MNTTNESRQPTLDEIKLAAARLTTDEAKALCGIGPIDKRVLASLFEAAFTETPVRGQSFRSEFFELGCFIHEASLEGCDDMDERMLAMPFGYSDMADRCAENDKHPFLRDAARDLFRAVGVYFLRRHAFWAAYGDELDRAEQRKSAEKEGDQ